MKRLIFINIYFLFSYSIIGQTLCALVSYPEFSNAYSCPHAYIDENLKVLYKENPNQFTNEKIFEYKDGLGRIRREGKFGFINYKGDVIIPVTYEGAMDFNEGLAEVKIGSKWGYMNTKGQIVIEPRYKISHRFSCGLAAFDDDEKGKHGFIDHEGKIVIPAIYDRVTHFKENKAWVLTKGEWGCIDKTGKFIIEPLYKDTYDFSEGFCWVKRGMYWALIDSSNKIIIPFGTDNHLVYAESGAKKILAQVKYGMIVSKEKGKTGYCSMPGLKKIIPSKFDEVSVFEDSVAIAKLDGKYGLIGIDGNFIIEPKYEELKYLGHKNIFALRAKGNNWVFLYKDSGKVTSQEFNNICNFETIR